jgi:hypothetical protein
MTSKAMVLLDTRNPNGRLMANCEEAVGGYECVLPSCFSHCNPSLLPSDASSFIPDVHRPNTPYEAFPNPARRSHGRYPKQLSSASLVAGCRMDACTLDGGCLKPTSLVNVGEADAAAAHVMRLLRAGVPPTSIAVQSPYSAQVRARWATLRARWVTLRARWVTLRARRVTLRARWVTLRARWVTLRARWVTLRARWVTLRARWATLRARWVTLRASIRQGPWWGQRTVACECSFRLRSSPTQYYKGPVMHERPI